MNIVLGVHPSERNAYVSRSDRRILFVCPSCKESDGSEYLIVEAADRIPGTAVFCDRCQAECSPKMVPNLPGEHGIWIGGTDDVDPESRKSLAAAGYKLIGYCQRKSSPAMLIEAVDPLIQQRIKALIEARYGGRVQVFPKPPDFEELEKLMKEQQGQAEEDDEASDEPEDEDEEEAQE